MAENSGSGWGSFWGNLANAAVAYYNTQQQSNAIQNASDTAAGQYQAGLDQQYNMWSQMYGDFMPYISGGYYGLQNLIYQMPNYMQNVIAPAYSQVMSYQPQPMVDPGQFAVNPVTGQVGVQQQSPQANQMAGYFGGPNRPNIGNGMGFPQPPQQPGQPQMGQQGGMSPKDWLTYGASTGNRPAPNTGGNIQQQGGAVQGAPPVVMPNPNVPGNSGIGGGLPQQPGIQPITNNPLAWQANPGLNMPGQTNNLSNLFRPNVSTAQNANQPQQTDLYGGMTPGEAFNYSLSHGGLMPGQDPNYVAQNQPVVANSGISMNSPMNRYGGDPGDAGMGTGGQGGGDSGGGLGGSGGGGGAGGYGQTSGDSPSIGDYGGGQTGEGGFPGGGWGSIGSDGNIVQTGILNTGNTPIGDTVASALSDSGNLSLGTLGFIGAMLGIPVGQAAEALAGMGYGSDNSATGSGGTGAQGGPGATTNPFVDSGGNLTDAGQSFFQNVMGNRIPPSNPLASQISGMAPQDMSQYFRTSPYQQVYAPQARAMNVSQADLERGGVLSPTTPTLRSNLNDYRLDLSNPVYQQRRREAEDYINNFLARSGKTGSTSGASYATNELDKLITSEDERQWNRFLTGANFENQAALGQYGINAARGSDLYNRLTGQNQNLYNQYNQGWGTANNANMQNLMNRYNTANNLYGTLYGNALDLYKGGAGAAGSAGAGSVTTGANMAQGNYGLGDILGNSILANSNLWGNYINGLQGNWGSWG